MRVADAGFFWLEAAPRARHWWLTAALDENGGIVQYYFDITLENDIRPGGQSSFLDLFLDVVLSPGGDVYILDRDELAAALSAGEISPAQYALALREAEALARALPAREGELAAFCQAMVHRRLQGDGAEGVGLPSLQAMRYFRIFSCKYSAAPTFRPRAGILIIYAVPPCSGV